MKCGRTKSHQMTRNAMRYRVDLDFEFSDVNQSERRVRFETPDRIVHDIQSGVSPKPRIWSDPADKSFTLPKVASNTHDSDDLLQDETELNSECIRLVDDRSFEFVVDVGIVESEVQQQASFVRTAEWSWSNIARRTNLNETVWKKNTFNVSTRLVDRHSMTAKRSYKSNKRKKNSFRIWLLIITAAHISGSVDVLHRPLTTFPEASETYCTPVIRLFRGPLSTCESHGMKIVSCRSANETDWKKSYASCHVYFAYFWLYTATVSKNFLSETAQVSHVVFHASLKRIARRGIHARISCSRGNLVHRTILE